MSERVGNGLESGKKREKGEKCFDKMRSKGFNECLRVLATQICENVLESNFFDKMRDSMSVCLSCLEQYRNSFREKNCPDIGYGPQE